MKRYSLDRSQWLLLAAAVLVSILVGMALPVAIALLGDSVGRLAALPALFVLGGLFLFNRKLLLLLIFLFRASGDIVLESTRVGGGMGLGAAINGLIILIAFLFVVEKPKQLPRWMAVPWLVLLAVASAGVLISPDRVAAIKIVLSLCSYFAVFVCAFYVVRTPEDFRSMVKLMIASSIVPALYGIVATGLYGRGGLANFRLQSTFGHPNILAFYLTLVISLGLYVLKSPFFRLTQFKRFALMGYMLLLFVLLLLTQTRSAWIASFMLMLLYGLMFERRYLIYLAILPMLAMLVPSVQERVMQLDSGNTVQTYAKLNSFAWRVYLWESGLKWMSPSHYLTGYGVESFPYYSQTFFPLAGTTKWGAHSVFVQWFFDTGLIGMLAYLSIFYMVLRKLMKLYRLDRLGAVILICTLVEYLVVSASDNLLSYLAFNWYFWLLLGMGCSVYMNSEAWQEELRQRKARPLHRAAMPGLRHPEPSN
ncbi:O-antigen ligase family protein [Herbaspirillum seropedicae]|uniref:Cholera toxin secretion EpsM protein n=1 Tax=Herbaspirillum seropedicae (strain SmR1) TaxID=757424 RepID=D8ISF1_HERSS|nr:O-antigen ligase family protein [Herbaspirillum seropedicae]ADJ63495.1 cholera toxin secretion EpsM protein [Herbaspirillum seropedicae SmR1]AKN65528.1 EpsM protein [Herbaspirillum seropedicae]AON54320.1 cholera toxin secretion EpsM protein [Herbaspirillum seropedicae]MDR6394690.1 O-antigen ligase [Herbaspirillum seropedicae]NQE28690.1 EpsM protein [Herbaspirillum seropedicae]